MSRPDGKIAATSHMAEEDIRLMHRKGKVQTLDTKPRICHIFRWGLLFLFGDSAMQLCSTDL